jgi:3-oxoacyl-[acyl-carrier protein] reductase
MKKKTIVITGASKGIGFATSQRLAAAGYYVIGIARSKPEESFPGDFLSCDLSSEKETDHLIQVLGNTYQVDGLVNNVGIGGPQPLGSIDLNALRTLYDINVRTAVQMSQGLIEGMKKQRWGRIINLSSRVIFGSPGRTSYAAAKSALIGCTKVWALELATFGVTVNAVAPGPIETAMFRKIRPPGSPAEKELLSLIPVGRIGRPQEVAAAIEFLLSEDAGFITGQTLCVDGGGSL